MAVVFDVTRHLVQSLFSYSLFGTIIAKKHNYNEMTTFLIKHKIKTLLLDLFERYLLNLLILKMKLLGLLKCFIVVQENCMENRGDEIGSEYMLRLLVCACMY